MNKDPALLRNTYTQFSTEQLDDLLAEELLKQSVDDDKVRLILEIFRERDKDLPVNVTPEICNAWEKYKKDSASICVAKPGRIPIFLIRAASVCIVLLLLFAAIPQQAQADNFWERLVRWTDDVFEFFDPHGKEAIQKPYVFKTDNPGLQQVYDKVVEMGITEPVVPMWLPDGYELLEIKEKRTSYKNEIYLMFSDGSNELIYDVRILDKPESGLYQKDNSNVVVFEYQGVTYYIIKNIENYNVTWARYNFECFLVLDCQEDIFKILKSIHG